MTESVADVKSGDDVNDRTTQTRQFSNDFESVCCLVARKARARRHEKQPVERWFHWKM